ncbi:hypothetical protein CAPTEDRAFT_143894, partial [Capitella teleta]
SEMQFLGHHISAEGCYPRPAKACNIRDFARPTRVKDLQRLLWVINYTLASSLVVPLSCSLFTAELM